MTDPNEKKEESTVEPVVVVEPVCNEAVVEEVVVEPVVEEVKNEE